MDVVKFAKIKPRKQLQKLDSHLTVRIFGNFMYPAVVVKSLGFRI